MRVLSSRIMMSLGPSLTPPHIVVKVSRVAAQHGSGGGGGGEEEEDFSIGLLQVY